MPSEFVLNSGRRAEGVRARAIALAAVLVAALSMAAPSSGAQSAFDLVVPAFEHAPAMNGTIDATWAAAARAPVDYDFTNRRPAAAGSVAFIGAERDALDVAFIVTQRGPVSARQETNGAGVYGDDHVTVLLFPQGTQGIAYTFSANVNGARDQTSSENSAYSPQWEAAGHRTADGYAVTMRIPRNVIRSGGATSWRAQFERYSVATSSVDVWAHEPGQRSADDPTFAGTLRGLVPSTAHARPKPRLQLYGLSETTTRAYGGSTSRVGADLAIPVTATSSLLAAFHPDYSNVEIDQQSISPNAYARMYSEVRPFFTQAAANFNNHFGCLSCPTTLYTPAIPAFRDGYAYSGTAGPFSFGAFDAVGTARSDSAETLTYAVSNPRSIYQLTAQRVAVDTPYLHDDTTSYSTGYQDQRTKAFVYANYAEDRGNLVSDAGQANYSELGGGYASQFTQAVISEQRVGSQFSPVDGFVQQADIAGYLAVYTHKFTLAPSTPLLDVSVNGNLGRYHDHAGSLAQTDGGWSVGADFRNLLSLHLYASATGIETADGEFLPFNANGASVGYRQSSGTPSSVSYGGGPYYHGHLTSWTYYTVLPLHNRLRLNVETDENRYGSNLPGEFGATQWLERASANWQLNRYASFDAGVRRIVGRNLPTSYQITDATPGMPCGTQNGYLPFDCVDAGNVTLAFHVLRARDEIYLVYGDPNSLSTRPALFVKWIRYIGAQKGT